MVPACFIPAIIRPGIAPTYVRRWPRISASSRTPPRLICTNLRPTARAMPFTMLVLPTPGGPTKHRIGPRMLPSWVFISFIRRTARYSITRSFTFSMA